jgi:nicotinamide mononucleotide transporter
MTINKKSFKEFGISLIVAFVVTGVSYFVAYVFEWIKDINWVEAASVFTSYSCTYMCVKQTRWNYPMGALSVVLLGILFFQMDLYSSMALQIYLFPWLLYGWFRWKKDEDTRPVKYLKLDKWIWLYVIFTAGSYFIMKVVTSAFGAKASAFDSAIFAFSILAQFLMDNKKIENWIIWAIVNIISIILYWHQGAYILAMQFVFFFANTIYGWYQWHKSMEKKTI